jgi:hypothetical protein
MLRRTVCKNAVCGFFDNKPTRKIYLFILGFLGLLIVGQMGFTNNNQKKIYHNNVPISLSNGQSSNAVSQLKLDEEYGKLPMAFEVNEGQTDGQVKYISRGSGYNLFITPAEAVLVLRHTSPPQKSIKKFPICGFLSNNAELKPNAVLKDVVRMRVLGGNRLCRIEGMEKLSGKSNYFIGDDPSKWRSNVTHYGKVSLKDVYRDIDLVYYGGKKGKLEYDFVVKPGGDPKEIQLAYEGAKNAKIFGDELVLQTMQGKVVFNAPVVYQYKSGEKELLKGRYVLKEKNKVSFKVEGYDPSQPFVIDPQLDYSTYLGGSVYSQGTGIATDSAGNAYVVGITQDINFPTTTGAYQTSLPGATNAFVTKLNSAGTSLIYSTYLGGNNWDGGRAVAVDSGGDAYITGSTSSSNFPTSTGAYQTTNKGGANGNAFVTELNSAGTSLIYSTYLGGSGSDGGYSLSIDTNGFAYVTGSTSSSNFPTSTGAYLTSLVGSRATFITKLNQTATNIVYSTYLGGGTNDDGSGIAVDSSGNAYVTGETNSSSFPTTPGAYMGYLAGGISDGYVTKLNSAGTSLIFSTCLGVNGGGSKVAFDSSGVYIVGGTLGSLTPTVGAFQTTASGGALGWDGFVQKLNSAGTSAIYSTYLGGNGDDYVYGLVLDSNGDVFVYGSTPSTNFPLTGGAYQTSLKGSRTSFLTEVNPNGTGLVYSTYFGGSGGDQGLGMANDSNGNIYLTGQTSSTDFPTTSGAYQTSLSTGASSNAFVAKFDASTFGVLTVTPTNTITSTFTLTPTSTVTFTPTNSSTATPSNTVTLTATNTGTATVTNTPTCTGTNTVTNTSTNTATNTETCTPTSTSTYTATNTATFTVTSTSTNTMVNTATNTATNTPTVTDTNTATNTPTYTATKTPTSTATNTATSTATNSPTKTQTNSSTITSTTTPTFTTTATLTVTSSNTATYTATKTSTTTSTNTPTNTSTQTLTNTTTPTNTFTNIPTNTPTSTPTYSITPTPSQTLTETPTASQTPTQGTSSNYPLKVLPPSGGSFIAPEPVTGNTASLAFWMDDSGSIEIRIFNAIGQLVCKQDEVKGSGAQISTLNMQGYAPGVYLYLIEMTYNSGSKNTLPVSKFVVVR